MTDVLTGGATEIIWTGLDIIKAIQEARNIYRKVKHAMQIGYDLYHFLHDHKHIHRYQVERLDHHHGPRIGMPRRGFSAQQIEGPRFDDVRPRRQEFRAAMQFHRPRRQAQYQPNYQEEFRFERPMQPQSRLSRHQNVQGRQHPQFQGYHKQEFSSSMPVMRQPQRASSHPQRRHHDDGCTIC